MAILYGYVGPYTENPSDYLAEDYWLDYSISSDGGFNVTVEALDADLGASIVIFETQVTVDANVTHRASTTVIAGCVVTPQADIIQSTSVNIDAAIGAITTQGVLTLPGSTVVAVTSELNPIPPTITLRSSVDITVVLDTNTQADERDFGVVDPVSSTVVVSANASMLVPAAVNNIVVSSTTTASFEYIAGGSADIIANSIATVLGNQTHDAGLDPYTLTDGYDYTWDNVGLNANWDDWPDTTWGNFTGPHIPVASEIQTQASLLITSGSAQSEITSDLEINAVARFGAPANISINSASVLVAGYLLSETVIVAGNTQVNVNAGVIRSTATCNVALQSTVPSVSAFLIKYGIITVSANSVVANVNAIQTHRPQDLTLLASTVLTTNALAVYRSTINISLGTITTQVASIRSTDPYRTALVSSETRTIQVIDELARTTTASSETRTYLVPVPAYIVNTRRRAA